MKPDEPEVNGGDEAEEEDSNRLMALLHELVRKNGRRGAARELGIDHRTVGACMDGGGMSWRVREALERALEEGSGSAAARQGERDDSLERRLAELEDEMRGGLRTVRGEIKALREERSQGLRQAERGKGRMETRRSGEAHPAVDAAGVGGKPKEGPALRRRHAEVVTREPAPDDEEVYGPAWPLIEEWRRLWEGHTGGGRGLSWLRTEERVRELEVAMLEEHGLTLPPETEPLHGMWRRSQLNWRKETLHEVRQARARRELLRRVLTLGMWWK